MFNGNVKVTWHDDKVKELLRMGCDQIVRQAAMRIRNEAVKEAPVRGRYRSLQPGEGVKRGGILKASIREEFLGRSGMIVQARVVTACGYGAYVELGTTKMPARPYILPAVDAATPAIRKDAHRLLERLQPFENVGGAGI